ncbi:MAG: hypothetical protein A2941_00790 [Candidatus Yanofskybacteria bacterium RIFCSPLOWO2_01_FULL_49_17]|uniref:YdbS-like PH domain-containing protein n=1 Tax=Candidatus Yanofskybacteria bacterium RIFCSPLOWO2_01_FULL_49_17 TaxID=1802700 RepID=A0A1F8GQY6_9BACT|nr:MAG: hypothetical protein A2941_00790 [Candidatus Yanofskybacteria bacterium RIFCSPLOWO2_01_FULL_49_17]
MRLHENETISATVHQHWTTIIGPAIILSLIVAIELVAGFYFHFGFFGYGPLAYFVISALAAISFLYNLYIWRENNLVITNLRVIHNEQSGLFNEKVTELLYRDITEASFTQDGPLALAYDYGTLVLRLPSEGQVMVKDIPHPSQVMELVNKIRLGT